MCAFCSKSEEVGPAAIAVLLGPSTFGFGIEASGSEGLGLGFFGLRGSLGFRFWDLGSKVFGPCAGGWRGWCGYSLTGLRVGSSQGSCKVGVYYRQLPNL